MRVANPFDREAYHNCESLAAAYVRAGSRGRGSRAYGTLYDAVQTWMHEAGWVRADDAAAVHAEVESFIAAAKP